MTNEIPKSDWKHFKYLHGIALERLCERALADLVDTASDVSTTNHERYLRVYREIKKYDKKIESAFDILSRSRMIMQLAIMQSLNLLEESEIQAFTQATKDQLKLYSSF